MKLSFGFAAVAAVSAACAFGGQWDKAVLKGVTDKDPCSYKVGEKIRFALSLEGLDAAAPLDGCKVGWKCRGDDGRTESGEMPLARGAMKVETSLSKPGFVHLEAWVLDANGEKARRDEKSGKSCTGQETVQFTGGAAAGFEAIAQGVAEPKDFEARWLKALKRLAKEHPVSAKNFSACMKDVGDGLGILCWEVEIPSAGPGWSEAYATGYLTMPKNAKPGSLKARVTFDGYGIYKQGRPQWCEPGWMDLHVNAHGIRPLTLDGEEFEAFKRDKIENRGQYGFNEEDNRDFEKAYFFGMAMRAVSATTFMREFAKSRPEWDGATLVTTGGSQGGLQATWAAAFVKGVSELRIHVPWCCDLGGTEAGRMGGWRPRFTEALAYYDPVNVAKRLKSSQNKVVYRSALGDYIAPPSTHAVLYNAMKAPKSIEYSQGGDHYDDPESYSQKQTFKKER